MITMNECPTHEGSKATIERHRFYPCKRAHVRNPHQHNNVKSCLLEFHRPKHCLPKTDQSPCECLEAGAGIRSTLNMCIVIHLAVLIKNLIINLSPAKRGTNFQFCLSSSKVSTAIYLPKGGVGGGGGDARRQLHGKSRSGRRGKGQLEEGRRRRQCGHERADAPHFPANQSLSPRARGRLLGVGVELQNE